MRPQAIVGTDVVIVSNSTTLPCFNDSTVWGSRWFHAYDANVWPGRYECNGGCDDETSTLNSDDDHVDVG